ncbi:MAG: hypothetical protein HN530_04060 [Gammaproteobacteria bacterium]|nr:hypothetical protein [Gammaproteobacteria bacterium]
MARVYFNASLEKHAGCVSVAVAAQNYRALLEELTQKLPQLTQEVLMPLALVIDGEIVQEPFLADFSAEAELHFIEKIAAG